MGPMAGFRWLMNAINLGRNNPKAVFGAAALSMVLMLVPSLLTVPLQMTGTQSAGRMAAVIAISMLFGLLLAPLYGGLLSIIDAAERGRPARATDVFAPYRAGGGAVRMIGFALGMLVVYAAIVAIVLGVVGTGIIHWYTEVLAAQAAKSTTMPALPAGFGTAVALFAVFWLLVMGVYAVGFGQVALAGRSPLAALKDGFVGSIKNLLPLLMLVVGLFVAWIAVALAVIVLVGIAALLAKLVGAWVLFVVAVPVYIALILALYVVMFGVMYFMWRDVCGGSDMSAETVGAMAA
jgi:hypothetical protein